MHGVPSNHPPLEKKILLKKEVGNNINQKGGKFYEN
jgi:hypothetical protein